MHGYIPHITGHPHKSANHMLHINAVQITKRCLYLIPLSGLASDIHRSATSIRCPSGSCSITTRFPQEFSRTSFTILASGNFFNEHKNASILFSTKNSSDAFPVTISVSINCSQLFCSCNTNPSVKITLSPKSFTTHSPKTSL